MMFQISRLPESALKPLFSEDQWAKLGAQLAEAKRREPMLKRNGYVPDNDVAAAPSHTNDTSATRKRNKDRANMSMPRPSGSEDDWNRGDLPSRGGNRRKSSMKAFAVIAAGLVSIAAAAGAEARTGPRFGEGGYLRRARRDVRPRFCSTLATTQGRKRRLARWRR